MNAAVFGRVTGALTLAGLAVAPVSSHAQAAPIFPIAESANPNVETTNNAVPAGALSGTLVLLESGNAKNPIDQQNFADWSDVVYFNGNANATLYSDPDSAANGQYFKGLLAAGNFTVPVAFINESLIGFTPYDPHGFDPAGTAYDPQGNPVKLGPGEFGGTTYRIYSDPANDPIPEASTTVSLGLLLALGGMFLAVRRKAA